MGTLAVLPIGQTYFERTSFFRGFTSVIFKLSRSLGISPYKGASIYDVRKIFGFFDPLSPLSANSRNLPY